MTKVVNLAQWCRDSMEKDSEDSSEKKSKQDENFSFEEIAKRNKENEERLRIERQKANKGVVRSHRLKK